MSAVKWTRPTSDLLKLDALPKLLRPLTLALSLLKTLVRTLRPYLKKTQIIGWLLLLVN